MRELTIDLASDATIGGISPLLEVTLQEPAGAANEPRPFAIVCPGGGYELHSEREGAPVARALGQHGFNVAVLRYSLVSNHPEKPLLPAPQLDLARATLALRSRRAALGIDPSRIVLMGFSAGAHVCALFSGLAQTEAFSRQAGATPEELRPAAQILCYPVIDLAAGWPESDGWREAISDDERLWRAQDLVTEKTPPTFLWQTATDETVPVQNCYRYAQALMDAGVDHECHVFHSGPHALSLATAETVREPYQANEHVARWLPLALEWLSDLGIC